MYPNCRPSMSPTSDLLSMDSIPHSSPSPTLLLLSCIPRARPEAQWPPSQRQKKCANTWRLCWLYYVLYHPTTGEQGAEKKKDEDPTFVVFPQTGKARLSGPAVIGSAPDANLTRPPPRLLVGMGGPFTLLSCQASDSTTSVCNSGQ